MFPDSDDFETFEQNALADDDAAEAFDLYEDDGADFDADLSPEEEARQDALEAEFWTSRPDPYRATGDKAVALLASHGIAASYEVDADADDDGRPRVESLLRVECRKGCGPVAHVHADSLADSLWCEAPEGEESACQRADEVLKAAGAYRDGWAS